MLRILIIVSLTLVLVIGASIGFFNAQSVRFNYLFGAIDLPLIALLVADFLLAALLTMTVLFVRMIGLRAELRRLRKQVRDTESEVRSLRAISVEPR